MNFDELLAEEGLRVGEQVEQEGKPRRCSAAQGKKESEEAEE